jgi:hypothetical protein
LRHGIPQDGANLRHDSRIRESREILTTTCYPMWVDPFQIRLSTPLETPKKFGFTPQTQKRQHPSRWTWTSHRKARSSISSMSARKSLPGVL